AAPPLPAVPSRPAVPPVALPAAPALFPPLLVEPAVPALPPAALPVVPASGSEPCAPAPTSTYSLSLPRIALHAPTMVTRPTAVKTSLKRIRTTLGRVGCQA